MPRPVAAAADPFVADLREREPRRRFRGFAGGEGGDGAGPVFAGGRIVDAQLPFAGGAFACMTGHRDLSLATRSGRLVAGTVARAADSPRGSAPICALTCGGFGAGAGNRTPDLIL